MSVRFGITPLARLVDFVVPAAPAEAAVDVTGDGVLQPSFVVVLAFDDVTAGSVVGCGTDTFSWIRR